VVAGRPRGEMTNCMTTNISTASLGWHLDSRSGGGCLYRKRSCSQPLDCLTAKRAVHPLGLLRQGFRRQISFRRSLSLIGFICEMGSIYTVGRYYGLGMDLGAGTCRRGSRSPGFALENRTDIGDVSRSSGRTVPNTAICSRGKRQHRKPAPRTAGLDDRESA